METTPQPPAQPLALHTGGTRVLTFDTWGRMRNADLTPLHRVPVSFSYDPRQPYTMRLVFQETGGEVAEWVASRDAFVCAGLHGVPLPGLDLVVTQVTVTRQRIGEPAREVPTLRVALYESEEHPSLGYAVHTGGVVYVDFDLRGALTAFLASTISAVPLGAESRFLDIDALVAAWRGR